MWYRPFHKRRTFSFMLHSSSSRPFQCINCNGLIVLHICKEKTCKKVATNTIWTRQPREMDANIHSKTKANVYIRIEGVKDVLSNSLGDDERKWFIPIHLMKKTMILGSEWSQIASVYTFAILVWIDLKKLPILTLILLN